MEHNHYIAWIDAHKPPGMPLEQFKEFLGLIAALTVQENLDPK